MVMDYVAMLIGYTMMATGAVIILGFAVYYAAWIGNEAHWKIVGHLGGYKALMQFKKWKDEQEAQRQKVPCGFSVRLTSTEEGVWAHFDGPGYRAGLCVSSHPLLKRWADEYAAAQQQKAGGE